jgi:hypothetical protein
MSENCTSLMDTNLQKISNLPSVLCVAKVSEADNHFLFEASSDFVRASTVEYVGKLHLTDGYKSSKLSHLPSVLCVAKVSEADNHFLSEVSSEFVRPSTVEYVGKLHLKDVE